MNIQKTFSYPGMYFFYLFLITGLVLIFQYEKGELLILLNGENNSFLDLFFKYWTYLGDGIVFVILILFFVFKSYFYALGSAIAIALQTLLVQGMKRVIFSNWNRPKLFLEDFTDLHIVDGVEIRGLNAFPSGHTATAFTIALILSMFVKNKIWSAVFFLVAILVGISRMYLLQHFFIDVYFGAISGILSVMVSFYYLEKKELHTKLPRSRSLFGRA